MIKLQISLNIPSYNGKLVHQIIGEHDQCKSLHDFCELLNAEKFIVLTEYYKEKETPESLATYYPVGQIVINADWIGKVKVFTT